MAHQFRNTASSGIVPVLVQNTSAEICPPYSVVAIGQTTSMATGVLTRETAGVGRFLVPIRKPDAAAVNNGSVALFLMTLDLPIQPNGFGYATTSLPTWVQLEADTYLRGDTLSPEAGSWKLHKSDGGPYGVRDVQDGIGWIEQIGTSGGWLLKTTEEIAARAGTTLGSGVCIVCHRNNALIVETDTEITAYNSQNGEPIPSGRYVQAKLWQGVPLIDVVECEDD